jgi:riboflavin-specific deaminase-like protein
MEEKSERFTSPESLDLVHRLRRCSDCVLVGRTTVERDNCTLTVRRVPLLPEHLEQPTRVVVDPNLHLLKSPSDHALLNDGLQTILYHSLQRQEEESFLPLGDTVSLVNTMMDDDHSTTTRTRYIPMSPVVQDLQTRGIHHIMVEGGPVTALGFLADGLVDRAIIIQAPLTFKEPVASNISESVLSKAGLALMGSYVNDGGDTVQIWSRPNLPWPTDNLTNWP